MRIVFEQILFFKMDSGQVWGSNNAGMFLLVISQN